MIFLLLSFDLRTIHFYKYLLIKSIAEV